jgi:hypothetical protein
MWRTHLELLCSPKSIYLIAEDDAVVVMSIISTSINSFLILAQNLKFIGYNTKDSYCPHNFIW